MTLKITWIPEIIMQTLIFIVKETLTVALAGQNPPLVPDGPSVSGQREGYKSAFRFRKKY